ncbi:hypothetical protein JX266_010030 [Neoarthrinium moseri]|nr:hypothetical protein JX266_010030 [Neoarthrinium moseri]
MDPLASKQHHHSLSNVDEDYFYSLPSSQLTSRHASAVAFHNTGSPSPSPQLMSLQSALDSAKLPVGDNDPPLLLPVRRTSSGVRWLIAFRQIEPEKHNFDLTTSPDQPSRKRSASVRSVTHPDFLQFSASAMDLEEPLAIEQLVAPPAVPVTTKRWSSTGIGDRRSSSMYAIRAASVVEPCVEEPIITQQGIEGIVASIRAYLSDRRHDSCSYHWVQNQSHPAQGSYRSSRTQNENGSSHGGLGEFLVSTSDIAGILEIVITGLRHLHEEYVPTGCSSVLLPRDLNARPTTNPDKIMLPAPCLADPATTISSVQPLFSALEAQTFGAKTQCTKATIVSRQSVTKVSWETTSGTAANQVSPMIHDTLQANPKNARIDSASSTAQSSLKSTFTTLRGRASSQGQFGGSCVGSCGENIPPNSVSETHVSFPALPSRHCTNEWISPLGVDEEELYKHRDVVASLYQYGIDAHTGVCSPPLDLQTLESNMQAGNNLVAETSMLRTVELRGSVGILEREGQPSGSPIQKHQGSSQGTELRDSQSYLPLMDRLRRYSFIPLEDHTPEIIRQATYRQKTSQQEELPLQGQRKRSSKELLEDILARSLTVSAKTTVSAISGRAASRKSSTQAVKRGRVSCSEDHAPHMCLDEQMTPTPSATPASDWNEQVR